MLSNIVNFVCVTQDDGLCTPPNSSRLAGHGENVISMDSATNNFVDEIAYHRKQGSKS
jgi:hypothetical protein